MAVSAAAQIQGREATFDRDGNRSYVHMYKVLTTSTADDEYDVRTADGLPGIGNSHPSDSQAYVSNIRIVDRDFRGSGNTLWIVEVEYTTRPSQDAPQSQDGEIRITLPRISYRSVQEQQVVQRCFGKRFRQYDIDGNEVGAPRVPGDQTALLNSAGVPFRDPPTIDVSSWVIVVQQVMFEFPAFQAELFVNSVNGDTFTMDGFTFIPGDVRMTGWSADKRYIEGGQAVYDNTMEFWYKFEGWNTRILDEGTAYLNSPGDTELTEVRGKDGGTLDGTVLLDGQGGKLPLPIDDANNRPWWLDAVVYPKRAFSNLPLPQ